VVELAGGPARARVLLLFGAVLALSGADAATVGAVAPQLEHSLHIGNAKVGLLSSVGLLFGAVFVIPVGMLVDRSKRMPMLSISVVLWSLASLFGAFASSYWHLLLWRLALGAVTATAGPAIASLTGDYFPRVSAVACTPISSRARRPARRSGSSSAARSPASSPGGPRSWHWRSRGSSSRGSCGAQYPSRIAPARAGSSPELS
jgi:MFS family permease